MHGYIGGWDEVWIVGFQEACLFPGGVHGVAYGKGGEDAVRGETPTLQWERKGSGGLHWGEAAKNFHKGSFKGKKDL